MDRQEQARIAAEIEALNVDYWYDVDHLHGRNAHEFYVEDGIFTTSERSRTGRPAIAEFYRARRDRGPRTARHVIANLRVSVLDRDNAPPGWILLLYAAEGDPEPPSRPAIMIADVHDQCRRGADRRWRYVSRSIKALFKSGTPTTA